MNRKNSMYFYAECYCKYTVKISSQSVKSCTSYELGQLEEVSRKMVGSKFKIEIFKYFSHFNHFSLKKTKDSFLLNFCSLDVIALASLIFRINS